MNRCLLLTLILFIASPASASESTITDPAEIRSLSTIQHNLDSVTAAVMPCLDSGNSHPDCLCLNRDKIAAFNAAVKQAMKSHTRLLTLDLVRFETAEGLWTTQSLNGIRAQANTEPQCP